MPVVVVRVGAVDLLVAVHLYIRILLKIPVRDCTSGYRLYHRRVLEAMPFDRFVSSGPSIVQETLAWAYLKGFSVNEIPIRFVDRVAGRSTFNGKIMLDSLRSVARIRGRMAEEKR